VTFPDLSRLDTSTTLGQVTFLVVAITVLVGTVRQNIRFSIKKPMNRSYKTLAREIDELRAESKVTQNTEKMLSRWQLVASELIRLLRNELADIGGKETERIKILIRKLNDLDQQITKGVMDSVEDREPPTLE
jgi:hypothetical protein